MDTARYSLVQSRPKNIFKTTVLKPLPPLFPLPPAAVSANARGRCAAIALHPSLRDPAVFPLPPPHCSPSSPRLPSLRPAAALPSLAPPLKGNCPPAAAVALPPEELPPRCLSCGSPVALPLRLPLCRTSCRLRLRSAPAAALRLSCTGCTSSAPFAPLPLFRSALPLRSAALPLRAPAPPSDCFRSALPRSCSAAGDRPPP